MGGHVAGGGGCSRAADILPPEVDPAISAPNAVLDPLDGRVSRMSIQHLLPGGARRSTIGVSPVTVIVLSIPPTRRSALIRR